MNKGGVQERPVHGGLNISELDFLGLYPDEIIDFSSSLNPLGPSVLAVEAARNADLGAYPDTDCLRLRNAIGEHLGTDPSKVLVGNGSTELIHLLARAYLRGEDSALVFSPTFGEYEAACRLQGVGPAELSPSSGGFHWDIQAAIRRIAELRPSVVFLCNPNNPTGIYLREREVTGIVEVLQKDSLLALDEAYLPFVEERWDSLRLLATPNVAVLRSMTKDYALTGLRLGYMIATEDVIERVKRFQYSWSVNTAAQAAGIAALSDTEHIEKGRKAVQSGKRFLSDAVTALGLECLPSAANFLLIRVGWASELRLDLLNRHKICVRDCASFGLPEYIRVGIRNMEDNRKLAQALGQVLQTRRRESQGRIR
ncbi:MAG: histidinol-phosphate transaminase [Dehalococcoidia bacterium]|nr:histidinol-phosphate transaminase [Dehalococcoidia bacterium]